jgi:hypothetical protein
MNDAYATTAQKDFILSLLAQREVSLATREALTHAWDTMTKREASAIIDELRALPANNNTPRTPAFDGLPKSFYAIPAEVANNALADSVVNNDLMFVVIDEFRGTVYMREVHGAPGDFNRSKLSARDTRAIAGVLRTDSLGFIKLFGTHFTVCGKCGANLTDQASRERGFGPDCARQLGIR